MTKEKSLELKVSSTLQNILKEGYKKVDINLKHFDIYEKGTKRILYNPSNDLIDMIYDIKKVFGGFESVSFSTIDFEVGK